MQRKIKGQRRDGSVAGDLATGAQRAYQFKNFADVKDSTRGACIGGGHA